MRLEFIRPEAEPDLRTRDSIINALLNHLGHDREIIGPEPQVAQVAHIARRFESTRRLKLAMIAFADEMLLLFPVPKVEGEDGPVTGDEGEDQAPLENGEEAQNPQADPAPTTTTPSEANTAPTPLDTPVPSTEAPPVPVSQGVDTGATSSADTTALPPSTSASTGEATPPPVDPPAGDVPF